MKEHPLFQRQGIQQIHLIMKLRYHESPKKNQEYWKIYIHIKLPQKISRYVSYLQRAFKNKEKSNDTFEGSNIINNDKFRLNNVDSSFSSRNTIEIIEHFDLIKKLNLHMLVS